MKLNALLLEEIRMYDSIQDVIDDLLMNPVESSGNIYHPIPFPEFSHLKTSTNVKEVYKKWDSIINILNDCYSNDLSGLKVLDIGANAGFFAFNFEKSGAEVTAFEPHSRYAPIGRFLISEKKLNVKWFDSPFERKNVLGREYDVTLMLSVFQWMADGGKNMSQAVEDLKYISSISKYLIFELGFNKGKSCIKTGKLNHYANLINLLKDATDYKYFRLLKRIKLWGYSRYLVICSNNSKFDDSPYRKLIRHMNF